VALPKTDGDLAVLAFEYGLSEDSSLAAALKVFDDFRDIIEAEMKRVYALLDRHFESITLQA
jgi:hypothetical protein